MLPRQFFFVYPPQHLRSGITFPIIHVTPSIFLRVPTATLALRYNFSYHLGIETDVNIRGLHAKEKRRFNINIIGQVVNQRLEIDINYSNRQFKPQTIKAIVKEYKNSLSNLAKYCNDAMQVSV
jgi:hypothetical protein